MQRQQPRWWQRMPSAEPSRNSRHCVRFRRRRVDHDLLAVAHEIAGVAGDAQQDLVAGRLDSELGGPPPADVSDRTEADIDDRSGSPCVAG
jgi:hypothetical protein